MLLCLSAQRCTNMLVWRWSILSQCRANNVIKQISSNFVFIKRVFQIWFKVSQYLLFSHRKKNIFTNVLKNARLKDIFLFSKQCKYFRISWTFFIRILNSYFHPPSQSVMNYQLCFWSLFSCSSVLVSLFTSKVRFRKVLLIIKKGIITTGKK